MAADEIRPDLKRMGARQRAQMTYMMDVAWWLEWELHNAINERGFIPEAWHEIARATPRGKRRKVTMSIDEDVIRFFREMGVGHLGRMAEVLKTYMHARLAGLVRGGGDAEPLQAARGVPRGPPAGLRRLCPGDGRGLGRRAGAAVVLFGRGSGEGDQGAGGGGEVGEGVKGGIRQGPGARRGGAQGNGVPRPSPGRGRGGVYAPTTGAAPMVVPGAPADGVRVRADISPERGCLAGHRRGRGGSGNGPADRFPAEREGRGSGRKGRGG